MGWDGMGWDVLNHMCISDMLSSNGLLGLKMNGMGKWDGMGWDVLNHMCIF